MEWRHQGRRLLGLLRWVNHRFRGMSNWDLRSCLSAMVGGEQLRLARSVRKRSSGRLGLDRASGILRPASDLLLSLVRAVCVTLDPRDGWRELLRLVQRAMGWRQETLRWRAVRRFDDTNHTRGRKLGRHVEHHGQRMADVW